MSAVRAEQLEDTEVVRTIHEAAFGRPDEARLVEALRAHANPYLGLVATDGDAVAGHIAFSPATLHCYNALYPIVALGPMAVAPSRQRRGVGSGLVREGLARCRRLGHDIVVVLGHPGFYPRFGFVPARPRGVMTEYPVPDDVFMVAELTPGALLNRGGVVYYGPEFALVAPATTRISARRSPLPRG